MWSRLYRKAACFFENKITATLIDIILLLYGFNYALIFFSFSLAQYIDLYFKPELTISISRLFGLLLIFSLIGKIFQIISRRFPITTTQAPNPKGVNHCLLNINNEIDEHIREIVNNIKIDPTLFKHAHKFETNIALCVLHMGEHIISCFNNKLTQKDIFISIYKFENFEFNNTNSNKLIYITHFDSTRDIVSSREIDITNKKFESYECVRLLQANNKTLVKFDCSDYQKSNLRPNVNHYFGFVISSNNIKLGIINIEFHNHSFFQSKEEMCDFVERYLLAFMCLLEYQFLKKRIFTNIQSRLKPFTTRKNEPNLRKKR